MFRAYETTTATAYNDLNLHNAEKQEQQEQHTRLLTQIKIQHAAEHVLYRDACA